MDKFFSVKSSLLFGFILVFSTAVATVQYRCDFEYPCTHWHWDPKTNLSDGFQLVTGSDVLAIDNYQDGPYLDYKQNNQSHFLLLIVRSNRTTPLSIWSNEIEIHPKAPNCILQTNLHVGNMEKGMLRIVKVWQNISWVISEHGDDYKRWEKYRIRLGTKVTKFQIVIEIDVKNVTNDRPVHLAVDNLELVDCKPNLPEPREHCSDNVHLECNVNQTARCLDKTQICDIRQDCDNGEDENMKYCSTVPKSSRCTFETGTCQWTNVGQQGYNWFNSSAGLVPEEDHTYGNYSGHFMYFDSPLKKDAMGGMAEFRSPVFNRLPFYHLNETSGYYNTCHVSFNYKQYGKTVGSLALYVVSLTRRENISTRIFWLYGDTGDTAWHRASVYLPTNITSSYLLVFEARAGFRTNKENFCALDDIVVSPLCFGIGVPDNVPKYPYPYDYFTIVFQPDSPDLILSGPRPNKYFQHIQPYHFTTCKVKGYKGPNQMACNTAYNYTNVNVQVLDDKSGVQRWRVNTSNFYTIIAKGASGGKPIMDRTGRKSNGAVGRSVMPFQEGEKLYIVVGQEGTQSCKSAQDFKGNPNLGPTRIRDGLGNSQLRSGNKMRPVKDSPIPLYGGGGGGGTFLFIYNKKEIKPLVISAGGGGLSKGTEQTDYQHGHGLDAKRLPVKGNTPKDPDSKYFAGAGGGWHQSSNGTLIRTMDGHAVESGPNGGESCNARESPGKFCGYGGFGGGGGGCSAGGGGGGYSGK
uniref:receptor protein-tyrosine kinase n=1 Tax=Cacopsylla melanoneura TaxID=428564 RepID=A0A8D9BWD3_9HEMI